MRKGTNAFSGNAAAAAALAVLGAPSFAWAVPGGDEACWPGMMWSGGWYGMILGPLMMIFFIALAVVVVVVVVRWLGGLGQSASPPSPAAPGPSPLDILKQRFARGEIDGEEFEQRRRVLGE